MATVKIAGDNAIFNAKTRSWMPCGRKRPHTLIDASGPEVGLPDRQMGNSGRSRKLGAGAYCPIGTTRLDVEIKERTFFQPNAVWRGR